MDFIYTLDIWTLNLIFMLLHVSVTFVSLLMLFVYRKAYLKPLALGYTMSITGFVLLALQGQINPFLSIIISNTLVITGAYLIGHGLLLIIGRRIPSKFILCVTSIHFIVFLYLTYYSPNMPMRVVWMSLETIVLTAYVGLLFFIDHIRRPNMFNILVSLIHTIYIPVLIFRILNAFKVGPHVFIMNDPHYALIQFWSIVITFFRMVFIILLVANDFESELKESNAKLHKLSYTDTLTGLHNTRSILEKLQLECSRIERYKNIACIAIIDIDHFKVVNDSHGHIYGDSVLKTFADICIKELRTVDVVSRYGGEEFLIIMPETQLYNAKEGIERLRYAVQYHDWDQENFKLTFSTGILEINQDNCKADLRHLIDKADQALYAAKKNGRDRIEIA